MAARDDDQVKGLSRRAMLLAGSSALITGGALSAQADSTTPPVQLAAATPGKPNIVVIFGDDIGMWDISAWSRGMMGIQTPNIDGIGREGVTFTDYYAEQSCTAGRSSFITGQSVFRTGLSKVGLPGADLGLKKEDPTIATLLKPLGYATGQFGKNHLGDRNEYLPTVHGFDEFFGNLYHLNAEEEPELPDYPKDPSFLNTYGPRGVLHCWATETDDPTVDPRFGRVGKQRIEDTGPLTRKRMETIDDETVGAALDFMERQVKAGTPMFLWWNATRMHLRTHVKPEHRGVSGQDEYLDGMIEHDGHVGLILKKIDELGIADNTILLYTTDNGPHANTWPDAATTPFRSEKDTNWEGAFRVPCFLRWPGKIKPGTISNQIVSGMDWLPTFLAAAGDPEVKDKLLQGYAIGDMTYKVHLDGYNLAAYLTGQAETGPRDEIFYFSDDGDLMALRYRDWKAVFMEQRVEGTFRIWAEPLTTLRVPKIFNLRRDPFERADTTSNTYYDWELDHVFLLVPAQAYVAKFLATFKDYPPRQRAASFGVDQVLEKLKRGSGD
jgi:arylsulfatase